MHTPKNCNDHDKCTDDFCRNGHCIHEPIVCDDNKTCTIDHCFPKIGCVSKHPDCDDNNMYVSLCMISYLL